MSAQQASTRLSESQKLTVECPRCYAGIGRPCKAFSRGPFLRKDGQWIEIKVAHIERKKKAMRKINAMKKKAK